MMVNMKIQHVICFIEISHVSILWTFFAPLCTWTQCSCEFSFSCNLMKCWSGEQWMLGHFPSSLTQVHLSMHTSLYSVQWPLAWACTSCRLFLLSSCPLVLFCFNSPHEALSLHVHAHYNSLFLCLSHTLMHTHKLCPLLILSWGFWPRAGYFSWSRFSQAPTGLFEHDSHWALTHYQCSKSFTENLLSLIL